MAALMMSTATLGGGVAGVAVAQEAVVTFTVPAGPLGAALVAYGRQAGLQVSHLGSVTAGVSTAGVSGTMSREAALNQLLGGTGLSWSFLDATTVTITSAAGVVSDGSIVLEEVNVTATGIGAASGAGFQGTPDWVYETPTSTSVVSGDAIANGGSRGARDMLDSVAGVMVNRAESQNPGLQVNVRGLQDQNRVATMVDGARQNFQRSGHGGTQQVYVDNSFIRTVEVQKSTTGGVGGAGSLGGSVNFRTLTADDIIAEGRDGGVETTVTTGTNAFTFDGNVVAGYRFSENYSIVGGLSGKKLGDYQPGEHGGPLFPSGSFVDGEVLSSGFDSAGAFFKFEGQPTADLSFDMSWIGLGIESSIKTVSLGAETDHLQWYDSSTATTSFHWDPASELVDLKGRLWFTSTVNDELRDYAIPDPVSYGMRSAGFSLENTSTLGALSLNYGVEAFADKAETDAIARIDDDGVDWSYGYQGMNPSGDATTASAFANATWEHDDWLTVTGGVRYDAYTLSGTPQVTGVSTPVLISPRTCIEYFRVFCVRWQEAVYDIPPTPNELMDIDKSGGAWLPHATVAVKPFDWLQPFVSYSQSYRAPTIMETLFSGGHPNVAPVDNLPNPNLRPEHAETWEVGANISHGGLITGDDSLRFKAVYFHREIEDYISLGRAYYDDFDRFYDTHVNLDGISTMKGVELEASYDAGFAYAGISYTLIDTDLADSYTFEGPTGDPRGTVPGEGAEARPSVAFVVPKQRFTVDAGVRLMDEKLVIGARATHVEETQPAYGQLAGSNRSESYQVYDLYASYQLTDEATLRLNVNNVLDEAYWPALGTSGTPAAGRTVTLSLNSKF